MLVAFSGPALGDASSIDETPTVFADITGSGFEVEISWLAITGITRGCDSAGTLFCPNGSVTRGQMAAFLVRSLGLPAASSPNTFTDDNGSIFEDDITRLAAAGITQGCDVAGTLFCPNDSVTRGQMAAFLVRSLGLPAASSPNTFTDDNGSIFEDDITRLAAAGITQGCDVAGTLFCPNISVTRGQMAAFLFRSFSESAEETPLQPLGASVQAGLPKDVAAAATPTGGFSNVGALPTLGLAGDPGFVEIGGQSRAPAAAGPGAETHLPMFRGLQPSNESNVDFYLANFYGSSQPLLDGYQNAGWLSYDSLPYAVGALWRYREAGFGVDAAGNLVQWSNCSGTLVATNVVLTAAHCAVGDDGWYFVPDHYGPGEKPKWWSDRGLVQAEYVTYPNLQSIFDYALLAFQTDSLGRYPGDVYQPMSVYMLQSPPNDYPTGLHNWDVPRTSIGYPTEGWFGGTNEIFASYPWSCSSSDGLWYHWGYGFYTISLGCVANGGSSGGPILQTIDGTTYVVSVNSQIGHIWEWSDYGLSGNGRYLGHNIWGPALLNTPGDSLGFDDLWRNIFS